MAMLGLPIDDRRRHSDGGGEARVGQFGAQMFRDLMSPSMTGEITDDESGCKVTVKNTFIDIEDQEDVTRKAFMQSRGAYTCTARFSEPANGFLMDEGRILPPKALSSPEKVSSPSAVTPATSNVQLSPAACGIPRLSHQVDLAPPPFAPPQSAAPIIADDDSELPPPPQVSPANFGRILLGQAIGLGPDLPPDLPSEGSALHGQLDNEGLPACQPCAWFHKPSGCINAAECKRCHLCPEGEPKLRKKQKVARIRAQQSAAETSQGSPSDNALRPAAATGASLRGSNGEANHIAAPQIATHAPTAPAAYQFVQQRVAYAGAATAGYNIASGATFAAIPVVVSSPAHSPTHISSVTYRATGSPAATPNKLQLPQPCPAAVDSRHSSPRWADIAEDEL